MPEVRMTITDCDQPDLVGTTWATDEEGNHYTVDGLTFRRLRDVNGRRCLRWHDGSEPWTGADWATAMGGECGEALNVVKKLRRGECGVPAPADPERAELIDMLAAELADTAIYLDLLAAFYGIDLAAAVVAKFNVVSERNGFPERLP